MKRRIIFIFLTLSVAGATYAQQKTNKQELQRISVEQNKLWEEAQIRVKAYAEEHNVELRTELEDGKVVALVDVVDGEPIFYITHNSGAAATTHANVLWTNPGVTGEEFDKIAIWDGGRARPTHQEFNNTGTARVTIGGNNTTNSNHSTHVAGTILAGGVSANAKGMAPNASLVSYYFNDNVESTMAAEASKGLLISNHSYGTISGWYTENWWTWEWFGEPNISATIDYKFGCYTANARTWDQIAYNAPYYLIVKSAGNDRGEGPSYAGTGGNPEKDGGATGYDCISTAGVAKNILTVGAVNKVTNYTGPSSVTMSSFSGWGPADDGRIKPDIVAAGVNLYSSSAGSNTSYESMDGTSMSAPNATGSLVLLQQYYQQLYGEYMLSATLKAVAIHTAEECGSHEGPDYRFGWGLLNVEKGAQVITDKTEKNTINELVLDNWETHVGTVIISKNQPFRTTICWVDPPGTGHNKLNDRTPVLVNDLDLMITDESGNIYYPYKLDYSNPAAAATKNSTNDIDNVEQIYIAAPTPGKYKIIVNHKGSLQEDSQAFSLITTFEGSWTETEEMPPIQELVVTVDGIKVFLQWMEPETAKLDEVQSYWIYRNGERIAMIDADTKEFVDDSPLAEYTDYTYCVRARYEGISSPGVCETITTDYSCAEVSGIRNTVKGKDVAIYWDAPPSITPSIYEIYRDEELVGETKYSPYKETAPREYTVYDYCVVAKYEKCDSEPVCIKLRTELVCGIVENLRLKENDDNITLTWRVNSTNELSHYIVSKNGEVVAETTEMTFVDEGKVDGTYEYCVTAVFDNCESDPVCETITIETVGINETGKEAFNIYPNPTTGTLRIRNEEVGIGNIQVFDAAGRLVREVQNIDNKEVVLDISDFSEGVYFINVDGKTVKVVKQ